MANTSNYQESTIDLDYTYIGVNDSEYFSLNSDTVKNRKTVVFGQNLVNNTYRVVNLGNQYLPNFSNIPKNDYDNTQVIAATPTAAYYIDTINNKTYVRAGFNATENSPQLGQWLVTVTTQRSSPVQVGADFLPNSNNWYQASKGIGELVAIKTDGTIWTCGYNQYGNLGTSNITQRSSPGQLGALTNWRQVTCWGVTLAIKTDNTLWGWGPGFQGALGSNTSSPIYSPIQIGALTNWRQVSTKGNITMAVKTDGTLWAVGGDGYWGALGLGNKTTRSSPIQVGSATNWSMVAAAYTQCAGIKTDGTLWTWGSNFYGGLGQGDTVVRYNPTQVGTLTDWSKVSCMQWGMIAIKTDGTLWSWGYNGHENNLRIGQLGLGDVTSRSSPVQVGTGSNWSKIACGYAFALAIKTDGTLWAWGENCKPFVNVAGFGQLGLGDICNRSTPVQVGTLSDWVEVSSGSDSVAAIKADGSLWTWGGNSNGRLGLSNNNVFTGVVSPVKISPGL